MEGGRGNSCLTVFRAINYAKFKILKFLTGTEEDFESMAKNLSIFNPIKL
jgi:hypothetical protein